MKKEARILTLLSIDTIFFLLELIIGYMTHSLALIADSFHMLNDIISLIVALWAVDVAKNKSPDAKYSYGWKRAEILGALINAVFLMALCFSILVEAVQRLFEPQIIDNPVLVAGVGLAGLISNLIGLVLFHDVGHGHSHGHSHSDEEAHVSENSSHSHDHSHNHSHSLQNSPTPESNVSSSTSSATINEVMPENVVARESSSLLAPTKKQGHSDHGSMNMQGVFLHVLGDALGNIGVIMSAVFIWKTDYSWKNYADPIVSLLITIIIFSSALPLSRRASKILLQATPSNVSAEKVEKDILKIQGVLSVHDFHIWNLTESLFIASVHVEVDATPDRFSTIAKLIRDVFHEYNIHSATVQPEFVSHNATADQKRRFSILAGSSPALEDQNALSSLRTAYGSTSTSGNCLVDQAANCNTNSCLPK